MTGLHVIHPRCDGTSISGAPECALNWRCFADAFQQRSSLDSSGMGPLSQDSEASSNLSVATSIQEGKGEGSLLLQGGSGEGRPLGEASEGDNCVREASGTMKGASTASSLAPVLEEATVSEEINTGRTIRDTAGKSDGHEDGVSIQAVSSNIVSDRADIDPNVSLLLFSQPISGTVFVGSTTPEICAKVLDMPVMPPKGQGYSEAAATNQAGKTTAAMSSWQHKTVASQHPRGASSISPALLTAASSEQHVHRKTTGAAVQNGPSSPPLTPRGKRFAITGSNPSHALTLARELTYSMYLGGDNSRI